MNPLSLTVFFPCHNEEGNVERVTLEAILACQRFATDYEVIIVNDGSKDRTGEIADRLAAEHDCVRVIHNETNLGYGGALQAGYRAATKEYVFYTDGDGQFDLKEIDRVLVLRDKFDIVSAYRINRQDSTMRKLNAFCWGSLVNFLFNLRIKDVDCAFKLLPRRLFDQIDMHSTGALIDTEVLAKARRLEYSIGQVGVNHYPRTVGTQSGANIKVIFRAFRELFRLYRQIKGEVPQNRSPKHTVTTPIPDTAS